MSKTLAASQPRLDGLDLARYLALAGMVLVNFRLALRPAARGPSWIEALADFLEGKASATFVVLAGLGFMLATKRMTVSATLGWTLRRALFLLGVGLLNLLIFPADIIHYYAIYFLLALPWCRAGAPALCAGILAVALGSCWALLHLDYGQGWNWAALHYDGLWQPQGFVRNLLFNGFHPVLPWLAFFLFGMLLAHLPLPGSRTHGMMIVTGLSAGVAANGIAALGQGMSWAALLGTSPLPPGPVYLLMGVGVASVTIGMCLRIASRWPKGPWQRLLPAGRMTLSLYLAHIVIGMGLLEALGALDGTRSTVEAMLAALFFLVVATVAAWAWSIRGRRGPAETLMRWLAAGR